jgi:TolB-like protein
MSLFNELKRRNVFRVAAAYLVIGWLLVQVLGLAADSFDAPAWVMKMIITVLLICFLPTLLFSWAYELTPEGLKKDSEVDDTTSNAPQMSNKLNVITLIAVIGVIGLFFYQQYNPVIHKPMSESAIVNTITETPIIEDSTANDSNNIDDASIAVLPFVDLSPDKNQSHFSDGIAEEILNVLVRIDHLKVASRTSAFGFKGQEALGIPVIAQRLNVRHVLEGSVRKSGGTVRITAQLIDAETDVHLWSKTFDRELTTENIFEVQDEIAGAIVKELGLMIGDQSETQVVFKKTTKNLDAYELYLKAQGLFHNRTFENLPEIVTLYEQAVAIDAEFAEAWAGLSLTYSVIPSWLGFSEEEYFLKAVDAADRATVLDKQLALPFAVKGKIASEEGDMIGAIELMDRALALDSKSLNAVYMRATSLLDMGYFDQAEAGLRHCLELDPSYGSCGRFLSFVLLYQGKLDEANALFEAGMRKGQGSYVSVFLHYYSAIRDSRGVSLLLLLIYQDVPPKVQDLFYRYQMEASFDLKALNAEVYTQTGGVTVAGEPLEKMTLERESQDLLSDFLWSSYLPALRKPTMRAEYLRLRHELNSKINLPYWRKFGFPPQCRAVGEDDFECNLKVYGEE